MKRTLSSLGFAGLVLTSGLAVAALESDATKMVRSSVDRALEVLRDESLQGKAKRSERHKKLRAISDEAFDWSSMARRSLGVHWRSLEEAQQERFTKVFRELLARNYLKQIDRFEGRERVDFVGTAKNAEGVEVKMKLVTANRESVPIHFFVGENKRVFDVSIEGVSIANHYRGTFDRLLVNGDFEGVMKKLERKLRARKKKKSKAAGKK